MRWLALVLALAACDEAVSERPDMQTDPGCGQVDLCIDFLGPTGGTFAQCAKPFGPGTDEAVVEPYFQCLLREGSTGSCAVQCTTTPDAGIEKLGCAACLKGTCSGGTCTGGACSAEASACF